jgi:hypothetical protein
MDLALRSHQPTIFNISRGTTMKKSEKLLFKKKLKKTLKNPCLLCGKKSYIVSTFSPHNSSEFGGEDGKQRIFFHALCKQCFLDPEGPKKVESLYFLQHSKCEGSA